MWPDNAQSINVFVCMATQWRVGPGGVIGLDYGSPMQSAMRRHKVTDERWASVFDDLQVMEAEALSIIHPDD